MYRMIPVGTRVRILLNDLNIDVGTIGVVAPLPNKGHTNFSNHEWVWCKFDAWPVPRLLRPHELEVCEQVT
jgi:hypothetical protein